MIDMADSISAVVQARVDSSDKVTLEDVVPLATPFSAHIDVCSVCNFKCSFCFQADTEGMKAAGLKRGMMPMDLFKKIVDDLAELPQRLKKVKIGNHGEPTLHASLPEMIQYLKSKDITDIIELFTNGSKLNPDLNLRMIDAGLQRINISLEGLTNQRYMDVAGAQVDFEDMIANITHLYENRGECKIYIKIADQTSALGKDDNTIFKLNDEETNYFFKTFGNICDEIYVENIVPQWARTQYDKQNDVSDAGMYGQQVKKGKKVCPFIFMYLQFNWDGTTSPCTLDWPKKVVVGNVRDESVSNIWNGDKLRDLQIAQLQGHRDKVDFCNDCSAPMVCCKDDLDDQAEELLEKVEGLRGTGTIPNQWISES